MLTPPIPRMSRASFASAMLVAVALAAGLPDSVSAQERSPLGLSGEVLPARAFPLSQSATFSVSTGDERAVRLGWGDLGLDRDDAVLRLHRAPSTLRFDGTNGALAVTPGAGETVYDLPGDFTLEVWGKLDAYGSAGSARDHVTLLSKGHWADPDGWALLATRTQASASLRFYVNGAVVASASFAHEVGRWTHFAATREGDTVRLFVDGVPVDSDVMTTAPTPNAEPLRAGLGERGSYPYEGELDDARLWSRALVGERILRNQHAEMNGAETGLVGAWHFEATGSTATDLAGNADGQLVGGAARTSGAVVTVMPTTATQYDDAAAFPQRGHRYCLRLTDPTGSTRYDEVCGVGRRPLLAPRSVVARDGRDLGHVGISWTNASSIATGVRVYRTQYVGAQPVAGQHRLVTDTPLAATTTRYEDDSVVAGPLFNYCVAPVYAQGGDTIAGRSSCDTGSRAGVVRPEGVAASDGQFAGGVEVTWTAGAEGQRYRLRRDGTDLVTLDQPEGTTPGDMLTYFDAAATPGTTHAYCVAALDGGSASFDTCDDGGVGILAPPSGADASDLRFDDRIALAWTALDLSAETPRYAAATDSVRIYRRALTPSLAADSSRVAALRSSADRYDDPDAEPGVRYRYCVARVSRASGSAVLSGASCDEGERAHVLAPADVAATDDAFEDRVRVTWDSDATTVGLFLVYRDGALVKTLSAEQRTYDDLGGAPSHDALYCVAAMTPGGEMSEYGAGVGTTCATGSRRLAVPEDLAASDDDREDVVRLTWVDASAAETGYRLTRLAEDAPEGASEEALATLPPGSTTYDDRTAIPGTRYTYRIAPFDAYGTGDGVTAEGQRSLLAPTRFAATSAIGETHVRMTWDDASAAETGYRVLRRLASSGPSGAFAAIATLDAGAASYEDTGLAPGVAYDYAVEAFDAYGTSARATTQGSTVLFAPTAFNASESGDAAVVLVWVDASEANTGYTLERDGAALATLGADETRYIDQTASGAHTYTLRATAGVAVSLPVSASGRAAEPSTAAPGIVGITAKMPTPTSLTGGFPYLGLGLDVSGDWALVVASFSEPQKLFVFQRDGSQWVVYQEFDLPDHPDGYPTLTPNALAIEGTTALVALGEAVQAYDLQGDVWTEGSRVALSDPVYSVAMAGRYGAALEDKQLVLLEKVGEDWVAQAPIPLISGRSAREMDFDGETVIVAPDASRLNDIYIYERVGSSLQRTQTMSFPPGPNPFAASDDRITSIAVDGDYAAVAVREHIYVLRRDALGTWAIQQTISPISTEQLIYRQSDFQLSVALSGRALWIGNPSFRPDPENPVQSGTAYLYQRRANSDSWEYAAEALPADPASEAGRYVRLGRYSAFDGNTVLFGSPSATGSFERSGAVYVQPTLAAPESVGASNGTDAERVWITWDDGSTYEDGFRIYRRGPYDDAFSEIASVAADAESFADETAAPGDLYTYCVAAFSTELGAQSLLLEESARACALGYRPANGSISGRIASRVGAAVPEVDVCPIPGADPSGASFSLESALQFDGVIGAVDVPVSPAFDASDAAGFTLEAWVRPDAGYGSDDDNHLLGQWGGGGAGKAAYALWIDDVGIVTFKTYDGTTASTASAWTAIPTGAWSHVAGVYDGDSLRVYIDGVQDGDDDGETDGVVLGVQPQESLQYDFVLGAEPSGGNHYRGLMDEVRVWHRARTPEELQEAARRPLRGDEDGLVAYWPVRMGAGGSVADFAQSGSSLDGHHGRLRGGTYWSLEEIAPVTTCAQTDATGAYTLAALRYGHQHTFAVTPTDALRRFEPALERITLSTESPVQNEVRFTDVSAFTLAGTVEYVGALEQGGTYVCPVEEVDLLLDGAAATTTRADGSFALVADLGARTLAPALTFVAEDGTETAHTFEPSERAFDVTGDVAGIRFEDVTRHSLTVEVVGGCGTRIGTATVRVFSESACYDDAVAVEETATLSLPPQRYVAQVTDVTDVPSGMDRADIIAFFDRMGVVEADLTGGDATLTFAYRAPISVEIGGLVSSELEQLGQCSASSIQVTDADGEPLRDLPRVPVLYGQSADQINPLPLAIRVVERYGDATCPVEGASVRVFDEIAGISAPTDLATDSLGIASYIEPPGNLPEGVDAPEAGAPYQTYASAPAITTGLVVDGVDRSFQSSITAIAEVPGRESAEATEWAVVMGVRPRVSTFATIPTTTIPVTVLRDPPGDGSATSLEENETVCVEHEFDLEVEVGGDIVAMRATGVNVNIGFLGWTVVTQLETKQGIKFELSGHLTTGGTWKTCAAAQTTISTSDSETFIGEEGDVYIGVGANFIYAQADELALGDGSCALSLREVATTGLNGQEPFTTAYTYTQSHIQDTLIPALEELEEQDEDAAERYDDAVRYWENQIAYNRIEKHAVREACGELDGTLLEINSQGRFYTQEEKCTELRTRWGAAVATAETELRAACIEQNEELAAADRERVCDVVVAEERARRSDWINPSERYQNRSFDAGASYGYAHTSSYGNTGSFGAGFKIGKTFVLSGEAKVSNTGGEVELNKGITFAPDYRVTHSYDEETTIAYTLADDDRGDYFSVDVYSDFANTTPIFYARSGRSSNPWEPHWDDPTCTLAEADCTPRTQPRDRPSLSVIQSVQTDVPPDEPALFTLQLSNLSDSDEGREYHLRALHQSNPGGAVLRAQGASIRSGLSFFVEPGETQEITLEVERGPNRFDYEDLAVMAYAPGEYAVWEDGGALRLTDVVEVSAHFYAPCSPVELLRPQAAWRVTPEAGSLELIARGFTLLSPDVAVDGLGMEVRRGESGAWLPVVTYTFVEASALDAADQETHPDGAYRATVNGATVLLAPDATSLTHTWTPPSDVRTDGSYAVRAFTTCGTDRVDSEPIAGTVDRQPPVLFGAPEPADAILSLGDRIAATFDEALDCESVVDAGAGQNVWLVARERIPVDTLRAATVQCADRTLLLDPGDLSGYENETLSVVLKDGDGALTDVGGAALAPLPNGQRVSWSFLVARTGVGFSPRSITAQVSRGQTYRVETALVNGRGEPVAFSLPTTITLATGSESIAVALTVPAGDVVAGDGGDAITGAIPTGGQQPVWFDLPRALAAETWAGGIEAAMTADGEALGALPFTVQAEIACVAPSAWTVDPALYQHSMALTVREVYTGASEAGSSDPNDRIAAFVDGEVRGVASVRPGEANTVSMLIYSDRTAGEGITFQVWDADACALHEDVSPSLVFEKDAHVSGVDLHAPPRVAAGERPVAAGWSWLSYNGASGHPQAILADVDATEGDLVKSQTAFATYSLDYGWVGSLTQMRAGDGYQVRLARSSTFASQQASPIVVSTPVALHDGWNWLGYLPAAPLSVTEALASMKANGAGSADVAQEGDLIKSQHAFAMFDGSEWVGSLETMEPGEAYLLYLADDASLCQADCALRYPEAAPTARPEVDALAARSEDRGSSADGTARREASARSEYRDAEAAERPPNDGEADDSDALPSHRKLTGTQQVYRAQAAEGDPAWHVDPAAFGHTMTVVAALDAPGGGWQGSTVRVALVDASGAVRAVGRPRYVAALDAHRIFLLVYGEALDASALTLRLYDPETQRSAEGATGLTFEPDARLGTVAKPLRLAVSSPSSAHGAEDLPEAFALHAPYPNPAADRVTLGYDVPAAARVRVEVYDALGRRVARVVDAVQSAGRYQAVFDARSVAPGLYVYRVRAGSASGVQRFLVVR